MASPRLRPAAIASPWRGAARVGQATRWRWLATFTGGVAGAAAGLCLVAWAPRVIAVAALESTRGDARASTRAATGVAAVLAPASGLADTTAPDVQGVGHDAPGP